MATVERGQSRLFDAADAGAGLDRLLDGLWEELTSDRSVVCPVCGAEMRPQYGVHARPRAGRCAECGSTLS